MNPLFSDEFGNSEDDILIQDSSEKNIYDPFSTPNRGVFHVYKFFYKYGIKYIANAFSSLPRYSKDRLRDFSINAREPTNMVNHFLQLRINSGTESFFRFAINSTIGVLGLWDVAFYLGLPRKKNDFGATMYFYGVPDGPYIMLLGPYNLRDTIGLIPSFYAEKFYFPAYQYFSQLDIVYHDSYYIRVSPSKLITLAFYSEYYKNNEGFLSSSFDEYNLIKHVYNNIRENELKTIDKYD